MPFGEAKHFETAQETETLGHKIEWKVGEFLIGSFDCIKHIERTHNGGKNDKKGIDLVVTFENDDKIAIDVTANEGIVVEKKIESMKRSPLTVVLKELSENGDVSVEKSKDLVPRALLRVDSARWEEYYIDNIDGEVVVDMQDERARISEEKDMLSQLLRQIEYLSVGDKEYAEKTERISEMLSEAMAELNEMEREFT